MKQIVPNFWFDGQAEAAAQFYTSVFNNAQVGPIASYTEAGKEIHGHQPGEVMTVEFTIEGQRFLALNGGPQFTINPSISFFILCTTAEEVDALWEKLVEDATVHMELGVYPFSPRYGWLSDKFGISWQLLLTDREVNQKIVPSLLFTQDVCGKAEEAMAFYTEIFPESAVGLISRYGEGMEPEAANTVMYGEFTIGGQRFTAMDSARDHAFTFGEGTSLAVYCDTQEEITAYWDALSAVPEAEACGWLKDRYGVSWQIVPTRMDAMMTTGSPEQLERVTAEVMKMKKLDIAVLEKAFAGE